MYRGVTHERAARLKRWRIFFFMTPYLLSESEDLLFAVVGPRDVLPSFDFSHKRVSLHEGIDLSKMVVYALRVEDHRYQLDDGPLAEREGQETLRLKCAEISKIDREVRTEKAISISTIERSQISGS